MKTERSFTREENGGNTFERQREKRNSGSRKIKDRKEVKIKIMRLVKGE